MTWKTRGRKLCRFELRYGQNSECLVRKHAQHQASFAVDDGVLEPAVSPRLVLEKARGQDVRQGANRGRVELPELSGSRQVIDRAVAHALAGFLPSEKRFHDPFELTQSLFSSAGIASKAVNGEFIRSEVPAPLDETPGLIRGELARSQIPFNGGSTQIQ